MSPLLVVFLLAVGGISIIVGLLIRPRRTGTRAIRDTQEALEDAVARATDLVAATRALTRELEQTGADVAGQSTERLRALKTAVAEADKRLEGLAAVPTEPGPAAAAEAPSGPAGPAPRGSRLDLTVDDTGPQQSPGQGRRVDRYEAIYRLADENHTVEEIAKKTQMGKGEVQLILSLRRPQ